MPVKVLRTKSSVEVLVALKIHGKPYYFIVDTGASATVLDSTVAKSLDLAALGSPGKATTIGCSTPLQPVAISDWSIGTQPLPGSVIPSQKTNFAGQKYQGVPVAGLLGADLYYLYGTMSIDFTKATLSLGEPVRPGRQSFAIVSQQRPNTGTSIVADVQVHGVHGGFAVDTGASVTQLDSGLATRTGLKKVGSPVKIGAISCTTTVQPVTFDNARLGGFDLPTVTAASSASSLTAETKGRIQGLLGADILSTYGAVTFDFVHQRVVLG